SNARAVFKTITESPGPFESPQLQFETCRAAVEALSNDPWLVPFLELNYWTDAGENRWKAGLRGDTDRGYGAQLPDHTVVAFNYLCFLPTYVEALTIYTAAGKIFFSEDFVSRHGEDLKKKTAFLEQQYNRIVSAITPLAPEPWNGDKLQHYYLDG